MIGILIILITGVTIVIGMVVVDRNKKINSKVHRFLAKNIFKNGRDAKGRAQGMFSVIKGYILIFGVLAIISAFIGLTR